MNKHSKTDDDHPNNLADEGQVNKEPRHVNFHKRVKP